MIYKKILLAVDLHPSYDEHTAQRAVEFAKIHEAELYILHCVEGIHAYGAAEGYQLIIEVERQMEVEAGNALAKLSDTYGIPPDHQLIVKGPPKLKVIEEAKKLKVDLIIVGGHGRHGMSLLFGSTTDGIIHNAHCDVLDIRAKK